MSTNHPIDNHHLDSQGYKLWRFSLEYELPSNPEDGRDWFYAISTADEEVHDIEGTELAWGSAWVRDRQITFLMKSYGVYTEALQHATTKVELALAAGSIATSQFVEFTYLDLESPEDTSEPPF